MNAKKIKPIKKVIIKSTRLRAIRDNLRIIVKLAVIDEYERLSKLDQLYLQKHMEKYAITPLKTLTSSQQKRWNQIHHKKEYLINTFVNSICVCASRRLIHDNDVKGDRVRVSIISEFEENMIPHIGARFILEEKWYSIQYYQENQKFFEETSKFMQKRMLMRAGSVITPQGIYQLGLKTLDEFGFA